MTAFNKLCQELETQIENIYENGITMEDAERLAARFLFGQIKVSAELKTRDLDARMRKSGVKAIRAAVYTAARSKSLEKITEAAIGAIVDTNESVIEEQNAFDLAEVERDELERYYNIFTNGHIYARNISKGSFGG